MGNCVSSVEEVSITYIPQRRLYHKQTQIIERDLIEQFILSDSDIEI